MHAHARSALALILNKGLATRLLGLSKEAVIMARGSPRRPGREKMWIQIPREDIRGHQGRPEVWSWGVPAGLASLAGEGC